MLTKTTKNLFQCSTMVSRILKDMLEPYPDIVAFKRIAYNGLPLYSFFKNEWFNMRKLVITMIMTIVNHVFVALWLHSWPWVWNIKTWPWNNHGKPWSTMKTWFPLQLGNQFIMWDLSIKCRKEKRLISLKLCCIS